MIKVSSALCHPCRVSGPILVSVTVAALLFPGCQPSTERRLSRCAARLAHDILCEDGRLYQGNPHLREIFQAGAEGLPWIFRVWLTVRESDPWLADRFLVLWDRWVTKTVNLRLDDEYSAMFPMAEPPMSCATPEGASCVLCQVPCLINVGEGLYASRVYNPIPAYERIKGYGTWPDDLRLPCLVGARAVVHPRKVQSDSVKEGLIGTLVEELRTTLLVPASREPESEDGSLLPAIDVFYVFDPPESFSRLIRQGPEGLVAIVRLWVELSDCRLLEMLDVSVRMGVALGFLDYLVVLDVMDMTLEEALSCGALLRILHCPGASGPIPVDLGEMSRKRTDTEGTRPRLREILDGSGPMKLEGTLALVNPILIYEEARGDGSWPKDLPVNRIQNPSER